MSKLVLREGKQLAQGHRARVRTQPILQDTEFTTGLIFLAQPSFNSLTSVPPAAALFSLQWSQGAASLVSPACTQDAEGSQKPPPSLRAFPLLGGLSLVPLWGPPHPNSLIYLKMGARYCLPPRQCLALPGRAELGGGSTNQGVFLIL